MKQEFTAIYEKGEKWWIASAPEIPGAHSQGETIEEARENLLDAIKELVLARRELMEHELETKKDVIRETVSFDTI